MQKADEKKKRALVRWIGRGIRWMSVVALIGLLIYFPGEQLPMAITMATGSNVADLQAEVDRLEQKAVRGESFTDDEVEFLRNLYTCMAKGGRLLPAFRQSSRMMHRYLECSGEPLEAESAIFINSRPVIAKMEQVQRAIANDKKRLGHFKPAYTTGTFYMPDPGNADSLAGLYYGKLIARPGIEADGTVRIHWRAEMPWKWPSYDYVRARFGHPQAKQRCYPIPNARSRLFGRRYCLYVDDGLGEHLVALGVAKPFLVYSEWEDEL